MATYAATRPSVSHTERTNQALAELYVRACAVIARHYREPLTLEVLARALASSPRQLQRAFDEIGQTSFSARLTAVRLRNGRELLATQPLVVRDVARLVGYRQGAQFARAFRARYGINPAVYRDRARRRRCSHGGDRP